MPFEGAGVISTWQLDLPSSYCQFDYTSIADVVMHINYTSLDGGETLKQAGSVTVNTFVQHHQEGRDLYTIFDLPNEFAVEWENALNPLASTNQRRMVFKNVATLFPIFTLPSRKTSPKVNTIVSIFSSDPLVDLQLSNLNSNTQISLSQSTSRVSDLLQYTTDGQIALGSWALTMGLDSTLNRMWMLVRYWFS